MDPEAKPLPSGEDIEQLAAQHRHYSEQLEALTQKPYLSTEEQLEEVRLKKLKLQVKDRIAGYQRKSQGYTM